MPLVLAGLMRRLSRGERLRVNAQRSDLREDFLVSWLTQLRGVKISFKTLARTRLHALLSAKFSLSKHPRCALRIYRIRAERERES